MTETVFEGNRRAVAWAAVVYGLMGALGALLALAIGHDPFAGVSFGRAALSVVLGLAVATGTVAATRSLVARAAWARALAAELRPAIAECSDGALLVLALSSGAGEELFFRGFVAPWLSFGPSLHGLDGVVLAALVFGALHQIRGRARWAWAAWATVMGVVFGLLAWSTGTLLGAVVAHFAINLYNLRYLRDRELPAQGVGAGVGPQLAVPKRTPLRTGGPEPVRGYPRHPGPINAARTSPPNSFARGPSAPRAGRA
jgi:membrane protease YdiL (CAAX protease family)